MPLLKKCSYPSYEHGDGCYGRVVALYIYMNKKWVKIGDYCKRCGEIGLLQEYENGLPEPTSRRFSL